MRNFRNYVVLFVGMILAVLFIMANGVQASPQLIFGNSNTAGGNTSTVGAGTNTTPTNSTPTNSSLVNVVPTKDPTPVPTATPTPTPAPTNTTGGKGNLPQTGENDIYIVSAIGAVALIIGGIAFVKGRKYDM